MSATQRLDSSSPHHVAARRWLERTLSSSQDVGLAWSVILAFLLIVTDPVVVRTPMAAEAALEFVDSWLTQTYVRIIVPGEKHWSIFSRLFLASGTAGNLTSDAHLDALALEYDCLLCSTDYDFKRFSGVQHVNPLEASA